MKRFAVFVAVVFAILLSLVLAWQISDLLLIFIASLVVAATLRGPIEWLVTHGIPRGIAALLVYAVGALAVLVILLFLYDQLGSELASFSEDLNSIYARLQVSFGVFLQSTPGVIERFPTPEQMTRLIAQGRLSNVTHALMGAGQNLAGMLSDLFLVLILSIYWTIDRLHQERLLLSLLPARRRNAVRNTWRTIEKKLGRYLQSELLQSLLAGLLLIPIFMVLGLRWPVFWALAVAVARLVPLVGSLLVVIPMAVILWIQSGPLVAGLAIVIVLVVLALLEFGVERRLYKRDRGMHVLTIMLALIMMDAFGLVGLLLAPPIAAVIHILLTELADPTAFMAEKPVLASDVTGLETRLEEVRTIIAEQEDNTTNQRLENIADRLETLLSKARQIAG